jgi:hypothetical protein
MGYERIYIYDVRSTCPRTSYLRCSGVGFQWVLCENQINFGITMCDSESKSTYTGRILSPSFMMQLIYGRSRKSAKLGILSAPQRASISFCALSCTHGCVARNIMLVRIVSAVVSAAACINAPTKLASFVPWNAGSTLTLSSSRSSSMSDSRLSPWLRRASTYSRALVYTFVGILKPCSARVVELSHCLGIHLKIGNCSVGRYVPGLKAAFTCSSC